MSQTFANNDNCFNTSNHFYIAPDDESKILEWLSPLEPWVRHRDIGGQRVDTIGDWLQETKEFRRWHGGSSMEDESNHATLFCDGNPGAGKSYICSLVIDKLCDEAVKRDIAVTCFYFDFASRNEQSPINMLGSLLRQLVSGLGGIPEVVVRDFQDQQKVIGGRRLQVPGILEMFQTIAARKHTFICVDALDECVPEHRIVVLESLGHILRGSPSTRIFMTGRPHVRSEVERRLDGATTFILIQPTEDGFARYLRAKLRNDTAPDTMSAALEEAIMKSIPEMSSETFLLASLHIDAILQETTIARRRKKLISLKSGAGLGDAYDATLERIRAQGGEKTKLAMATLTWICHAERPLVVDELCHALAVEIGETDFDAENAPSIGSLLGYCQGLITVDKEASTVRLIHFTVQEYLCTQPDLFRRPHSTIAETCLTYLNSHQVNNLSSYPLSDCESMPFLKYASIYWGTHANRESSKHVRTLALELLAQYNDHISAVSLLKQVLRPRYLELIGTSPHFSGLHYASFFGIVELVTALINEKGCDINQRDGVGRTPLSWGAGMGHEGAVKILLEREDAGPGFPDKHDRTPLGWAALDGHEGVVKQLLGRGDVDPNHADYNGHTPLGIAALGGHEGVVRLLLEWKDVDPNPADKIGRTPLGIASFEGHEGVVRLLLGRKDVDPNHTSKTGRTPLGIAAFGGHEGVVRLLLGRKDVDPNPTDRDGRTPLGIATYEGHEGVVRLLLGRKDADPNPTDRDGRTPLGIATYEGHEGVVRLLLEWKDVDPNPADKIGRTPLGIASFEGHEGVVRLLLGRKDVDPNHTSKIGRTPLGIAAYEGHEGVVRLLLGRKDVDPDRPDNQDFTPLSLAAYNGHGGVAKLLLDRNDVDPNHLSKNGRTPLGWAAQKGHGRVVNLLLEREGVDPDGPDKSGHTPLSYAALNGDEEVVKLLQAPKSP